jgi:hypothetical protein
MFDSTKKEKSDFLLREQVVYEYIVDIPFEKAVKLLADSSGNSKTWQLRLFERDSESRNYYIALKYPRNDDSVGYQLHLRRWVQEQSRASIHKVDFSEKPNLKRDILIYTPFFGLSIAVVMMIERVIEPNYYVAMFFIIYLLSLIIFAFVSRTPNGVIEHSAANEKIILDLLQGILGKAETEMVQKAE